MLIIKNISFTTLGASEMETFVKGTPFNMFILRTKINIERKKFDEAKRKRLVALNMASPHKF